VLDITIPQSNFLGAHHQGAEACVQHEYGYRSRFGVSSLISCKPCAGCDERHSLMSTRFGSRMYCLSCNPSCVGSRFGTKVKLFEGMGS
jgi:hypothetical protein